MHFRFSGNPNTNNAGRLFLLNKRRAKAGLPPLKMEHFDDVELGKLPGAIQQVVDKQIDADSRRDAQARGQTMIF